MLECEECGFRGNIKITETRKGKNYGIINYLGLCPFCSTKILSFHKAVEGLTEKEKAIIDHYTEQVKNHIMTKQEVLETCLSLGIPIELTEGYYLEG